MTLTEADVSQLESAGQRAFCFVNDDGDLQLVNVDGHCVFLGDGRCSVREDRPEGCRLYPMMLDLSVDQVVLDAFCPWAAEFHFTREDEVQLRRSVVEEAKERRIRTTKR